MNLSLIRANRRIVGNDIFWISFFLIVIVEMFSLIAWQLAPVLQPVFFFLIILGTLALAFYKLEYALLVAFTELFIGSFGHLFMVEFGPISFSLRIGLFLLLNTFYFFYTLKTKSVPFRKSIYFWPNLAMFGVIILGFALAIIHGHKPMDIFHDADAYIAFAYFPIAYAVFRIKENRDNLLEVLKASIVWLGIQTAVVLFIFSHNLRDPMRVLYLWIRDARIGEITLTAGDFYRVFFQSYIFALLGVFLFGVKFFSPPSMGGGKGEGGHYTLSSILSHQGRGSFWLFVLCVFLVLVSFSRSFWFGAFIAGIVLLTTFYLLPTTRSAIWQGIWRMFIGVLIALAFIFTLVNFPLPPKGPPILIADLFSGRALSLFGDAAAQSRWQLLPAMMTEIKQRPILGWGFGKTITYHSTDPRILAENPSGLYTTFAFEWGYLDLWLKVGLVGLAVYGWFIFLILKQGWQRIRSKLHPTPYTLPPTEYGLWLGFIALIAANVFTPYLNHPLGIGMLIMVAAWFDSHEHSKSQ